MRPLIPKSASKAELSERVYVRIADHPPCGYSITSSAVPGSEFGMRLLRAYATQVEALRRLRHGGSQTLRARTRARRPPVVDMIEKCTAVRRAGCDIGCNTMKHPLVSIPKVISGCINWRLPIVNHLVRTVVVKSHDA